MNFTPENTTQHMLDVLDAAIESVATSVRASTIEIHEALVGVDGARHEIKTVSDELAALNQPQPPEGDSDYESLFVSAEEEDDATDASVATDGESGEDADENDGDTDTDSD